ncbi:hypothetical protein DL770_002076 [Monosporascus sp. CRB-9-2]|nr:hypothetical protein DL770_002076 [Monosporascus sp. CRB-9-2]
MPRPGFNPLRETIPPWVEIYDPDVHGELSEKRRPEGQEDLKTPRPIARSDTNKSTHKLKRRVSKDGYVEWVDEKHDHASRLPVFLRKRADKPGRRWDHLRTADPVIMGLGYRDPHEDPYARWRDFIRSSAYGLDPNVEHDIVPYEVLQEQMPGLSRPVRTPLHPLDPMTRRRSRKKTLVMRFKDFVLRHPIAPLIFRLIVLISTLSALAVAVNRYKTERNPNFRAADETSQAKIAIIIDTIAVPYIMYMTWDEYTGKPLGLRPAAQKVSLTLLDLIFIAFKSASTALAFEALVYHTGNSRPENPEDPEVRRAEATNKRLAEALAALMLVGVISWILNFTISVFRVAEKLGGLDNEPRVD